MEGEWCIGVPASLENWMPSKVGFDSYFLRQQRIMMNTPNANKLLALTNSLLFELETRLYPKDWEAVKEAAEELYSFTVREVVSDLNEMETLRKRISEDEWDAPWFKMFRDM